MSTMEQDIRDVELRLAEAGLQARLAENLALLESIAPELHARFAGYAPERMRLHYADEGYVEVVDVTAGNRPLYGGDPVAGTAAQFQRFAAAPTAFQCDNVRANILDEESSAHVSNANAVVDMLEEYPAQLPGELPDFVNFLLVLGVGLGHHLEGLLQRCDIRNLCIVEPDADLFFASLHTVDWAAVVSRFAEPGSSLELIVGANRGETARQLHAYLDDIGGFNVVHPFVYRHLGGPRLAETFTDFAEDVVPRHISALGYFDDEQVGFAHSLANHHRKRPLLRRGGRPAVRGGGEALPPVFVAANGPSLDAAIGFLRENRHRGVLVSCGTALGSLAKAGLHADFHVEMERTRPVVEWIENATTAEERAETILLALNTVHPEVFDLFPRAGMALKARDVGTRHLRRYIPAEVAAMTLEDCNPTVANAALAHVVALGFRDVYLFGLDLGFPADGRHHSTLSKHYDVKASEQDTLGVYRPESAQNSTAPGNFGGEVLTTPVYLAARAALERVVSSRPGVRVWNTSDGIRIAGAQPVRVPEIVLEGSGVDGGAIARGIFEARYGTEGIRPADSGDVDHLVCGVLGGVAALRRVVERPVASRREGLEVLEELRGVVNAMDADPQTAEAAGFLVGSVSIFTVLLAQALHRLHDEEASLGLYRQAVRRCLDFLYGAERITGRSFTALDTRSRDLARKLRADA